VHGAIPKSIQSLRLWRPLTRAGLTHNY
jgi:hypothetical protein